MALHCTSKDWTDAIYSDGYSTTRIYHGGAIVTEIWMRKEQILLIYEATSVVELVILWMFRPAK